MDFFRLKTPFCGRGDLRSVAIAAGYVYLILALAGVSAGFGYKILALDWQTSGYGSYGENYLLTLLGVSSVVWMISNISLIHGAVKRRHSFILPWIYWQLVFIIIALAVLIWSWKGLAVVRLKDPMLLALCCVAPFLLTVIYSFSVVYSFYCDLKGVKRKEDMPETSAAPRPVMPPSSSTSHKPPAALPTTEEHVFEDLHNQIAQNKLRPNAAKGMASCSSTSHKPPAALPTTEEHVYEDLHNLNAQNKLRPNAAKAEQEGIYAVYAYTLPDRYPETDEFV